MTAIQQILYARDTSAWHAAAGALGLEAPYPPAPEWGEFHGRGSLAIHSETPGHLAGSVDLHLLVDDLDAAERVLAPFGASRSTMAGVGEMLTVSHGVEITVSAGSAANRDGALAVQPIWFAPDVEAPRRILEALGLRPTIASDRGGWIELEADGGGLVGLHHGDEPRIGLSFLAADLDGLVEHLRDAGYDAAVVDEAFGRSVRFPNPDGGDEVRINGPQDDLYGYHREG
ncbi:hypothetical protein [Microbacterium karelineae]|uniref:hypothetical protein n=1 Tax=Microbacterium karelineae TaxID=2654283 RepID=UPI0012EA0D75|nr:hypothetical protein [Microbacterium karelineae]